MENILEKDLKGRVQLIHKAPFVWNTNVVSQLFRNFRRQYNAIGCSDFKAIKRNEETWIKKSFWKGKVYHLRAIDFLIKRLLNEV